MLRGEKGSITKLLFICLVLVVLAACGTSQQTAQAPAAEEQQPAAQQADSQTTEKVEGVELIVSTAVSLTDAVEEMKTVFEHENEGIKLSFNFGSSGKLAEQISQGAPADIFLSASQKDMDTLADQDLIIAESRFDFAGNVIVLITEKEQDLSISKLEELVDLDIQIALGHVESTPLGRYAKESFENLGIWDKLEGKIVFGSDVRQVLSFVEAGNADVGILYNTDAITSDKVKVLLEFDPSLHTAVNYPAAVIKDSKHPEAAQKFLDFIDSEQGKAILTKHGFLTK